MSDRLLTPDEMPERWGAPVGDMTDLFGNLLATQDAKSVKVDRGAMAAWLEENYGRVTIASLVEALRVNKVAWEEKDAVHTARKTPRTIPPD